MKIDRCHSLVRPLGVLLLLVANVSAVWADEAKKANAGESFRMPVYPDAAAPPARKRVEIEKLLAGADEAAAKVDAASARGLGGDPALLDGAMAEVRP